MLNQGQTYDQLISLYYNASLLCSDSRSIIQYHWAMSFISMETQTRNSQQKSLCRLLLYLRCLYFQKEKVEKYEL